MLAFFRRQNGRAFFPPLPIAALPRRSWRGTYSTPAGWDASLWLENFCDAKGQRDFDFALAFYATSFLSYTETSNPQGVSMPTANCGGAERR